MGKDTKGKDMDKDKATAFYITILFTLTADTKNVRYISNSGASYYFDKDK